MSESHREKVAALRLFYPSISSVLFGNCPYYRGTVFQRRRTIDLSSRQKEHMRAMIKSFGKKRPKFDSSVFVSENAYLVGDIRIGKNSSIWPGAVLRADRFRIEIGCNCSVQDNCVVHAGVADVIIGDNVTVGHGSIIHCARIGNNVLMSQVRVVVVAQYDPRTWMSRALADKQRHLAQAILECAADNGMATVDTFSRLAAEPRPLELYNSVHLNPRGNQMIASLLAATLPGLLVR